MIVSDGQILNSDVPVDALLREPFKMAELRQIIAALLSSERPNASLFRACGPGLGTPAK
jgi:hypothetical protein